MEMKWDPQSSRWRGECPRCEMASFFAPIMERYFRDDSHIDVVECPGLHPFVIWTSGPGVRNHILFVSPISESLGIPSWLPPEYQGAFGEMFFDFKSKKFRSAVAVAGIILDAHINCFMKSESEKKKPLAWRLETLVTRQVIDADQFAESTVARLSRNQVIHPEDISTPVTEEDAKEVIESVTACLERYYKFRKSKALPAAVIEETTESAASEEAEGK